MSAGEAKFLPGSDVNVPHNVTSSEFVYYRVYHKDGAIATKRPAYLDDIYIGRIRSKWVTPPHTAGSLKRCLSSMENIKSPEKTKLFASVSNRSALADQAPISLKSNQTVGIIPEDPVILLSEAMPYRKMQPGTESLRVAPDRKSPVAPRFLFYGVYSEASVRASKAPIDAEQPWVSKIDLDLVSPPVSVISLLHILNMQEGINISSQLLTQDGKNLGDDQIFSKDGNWLGASAEDHLVLQFGRLPFAQGSQYRIQNCCTGNSLGIEEFGDVVQVVIHARGYHGIHSRRYHDDASEHFILGLQDDGSANVAFGNVECGKWIAPNGFTSDTKHGFCVIASTTKKNYFFICEGDPVSRKAFFDHDGAEIGWRCYYPLELRDLDTTYTRQMWSFNVHSGDSTQNPVAAVTEEPPKASKLARRISQQVTDIFRPKPKSEGCEHQ